MSEKVGGKLFGNACACSKTQKCILDGAWLWVFVLINCTPTNKLQTLPLIEEHVAISNPELRELLIGHWHGEHVTYVDSAIKDVLGSEIRALCPGSIDRQRLASKDLPFLTNWAYLPLLRNDADLGSLVAGFHFHTAPIFLRCSSTRLVSVVTSSVSFGSGVA